MKRIIFFVLLISTFSVACTVQGDSEALMVEENNRLGYEEFLNENGLLVTKMNKMVDEEDYRLRYVEFLNDNELLVMKKNRENLRTRKIELVDINSGTVKQIYEGELSEDPGNHLSIINGDDNNILISGYEAALVISRDQAVFDEIKFERDIWANALLPDGNLLCYDNGEVYLFDLKSQKIQHLLDITSSQNLVNCWFKINSDGTEALFVGAKENYDIEVYKIDLITNSFRLLYDKRSIVFWKNENILLVQEGIFSEYPAKLEIMGQEDVVVAVKNYSHEEAINIKDISEDLILIDVIDKRSSGSPLAFLQILDNNLNEVLKISDIRYINGGAISPSSQKIAFIAYLADDDYASLCIVNLDTQNKN